MSSPDRVSSEKTKMKSDNERDVESNSGGSILNGEVGSSPTGGTTKRGLKSRHAQMIALGGTIGTGLFVGAGQGLSMGGPLFLLLSYSLITIMLYGVATATGEMSSYLPIPGCSVAYYSHRFVSPSLGFTLGWVYWYIFAITVPAEITASTLVINYWENSVPDAVWITVIMIVIVACNCFPVKVYGEVEFWFASTKVIGIIGLLIIATVLFFGGGPTHDPLYFKYWGNPGPVNEYLVEGRAGQLCAFVSVLTFSVFAFAFAPELLVVTGGEMEAPRRNIPTATKRYFYRLIVFYILGALGVGIIIPSNHPALLSSGSGASASPWAAGIRDAKISGLDAVVNAVILLSAWSAGNSYLYLASRALYSLAVSGNAPAVFTRCTKGGIPYYATAVSAAVSLLAYLNVASTGAVVFNWFINLINTGAFQSFACCCFIYIRFRKAMDVQGITDVPMRSRFQPYSAWVSGFFFTLLLLLNGFKVFVKGHWNTSTFLTSYLGIAIFAGLYFGHRYTVGRGDEWALRPQEVDLHSGLDVDIMYVTPQRPREKWYQKWRAIFE